MNAADKPGYTFPLMSFYGNRKFPYLFRYHCPILIFIYIFHLGFGTFFICLKPIILIIWYLKYLHKLLCSTSLLSLNFAYKAKVLYSRVHKNSSQKLLPQLWSSDREVIKKSQYKLTFLFPSSLLNLPWLGQFFPCSENLAQLCTLTEKTRSAGQNTHINQRRHCLQSQEGWWTQKKSFLLHYR